VPDTLFVNVVETFPGVKFDGLDRSDLHHTGNWMIASLDFAKDPHRNVSRLIGESFLLHSHLLPFPLGRVALPQPGSLQTPRNPPQGLGVPSPDQVRGHAYTRIGTQQGKKLGSKLVLKTGRDSDTYPAPLCRGEGGYVRDPISEKKKEKINPTERLFSFFFLFLEDKR